ncbi:MAG: twin-arginine translocase subunit TatC [Pirellulaceae bacterium]
MSAKLPADDLFEKSSMSFGDHLEELRKSVGKSLLWLAGGAIIGLLFANQIVRFVETPLRAAIKEFHIEQAKKRFEAANGEKPSDAFIAWLNNQGMLPERVQVDPMALALITNDVSSSSLKASDETSSAATEDTERKLEEPKSSDQQQKSTESANEPTKELESGSVKPENVKQPANSEQEPVAGYGLDENPWAEIDLAKLQRLRPLMIWRPIANKLVSLNPVEGFMIWLKAGLVAGVVIGSPGIFFHVWQFIAAGLYPHERRYVYWYLPLSLGLFLAGVSLAFFVVFKFVLGFLMKYSTGLDVEFTPRLSDYMSFALFLPLGFGVAFQLPIVMLGLHRFGLVSVSTFLAQWRIAVLVIAFLSMVLSPPDIYSMMGLFLPLVVLYFFGVFLCRYMPQGSGIGGPAFDPEG